MQVLRQKSLIHSSEKLPSYELVMTSIPQTFNSLKYLEGETSYLTN